MATNASSAGGIISIKGSHVHQIKEYSLAKGLGNGTFIQSSTFSVGDHRWYIRFYPNGNSAKSAGWVSVFLRRDNTDHVDVKAQFKLSLVDPIVEVTMFSGEACTTFSPNHLSWGFQEFLKKKTLEESSYLKDDCLKVRCDVTISKDMKFVVVPPSNMHQQFGCLLSGAVGADVTFDVAGEIFVAHRCVLAARSSVFMAELFGPVKEKDNSIRIQDMEARVFKAMLHFIYTDTMPDIDREDAFVITQHLLEAADRYDLERLRLICEDRLCMCIDTSTVVTTLALAERHGCHGLKNACFDFLKSSRHLKMVMATEAFDHLMTTYPSLIKELLANGATFP